MATDASTNIADEARQLLRAHGEEAPLIAAMRADERFANGDIDAFHYWIKVRNAIETLMRPLPGTTVQ